MNKHPNYKKKALKVTNIQHKIGLWPEEAKYIYTYIHTYIHTYTRSLFKTHTKNETSIQTRHEIKGKQKI